MFGSRSIFIKVLSDDFADVDVREDLCYHSRPKKAKFERRKNGQKTNVGKQCAAGKAAADPKRFSGDGSATAALSGSVSLLPLGRGLVCGGAQRRRTRL